MNESGPLRKVTTSSGSTEYCDFVKISDNVWRATRDGKYWLLKTPRDSRFYHRREYDIAKDLSHPFIASTVFYEENTKIGPAIVAEYIEGRNLRQFASEKPSGNLRRKVMNQILEAVKYLHTKGLIHNDIKPENILVTTIGNDAKLIDFGMAETDADYLNRRLGGTPGSSAPEVMSGDLSAPSTGASDIYSIGGIIDILFPGKYKRIVRKCHRDDPKKRYADIESVQRVLSAHRKIPVALVIAAAIIIYMLIPFIYKDEPAPVTVAMPIVDSVKLKMDVISRDMHRISQKTFDTIKNKSFVPYQEFYIPYQYNWHERIVQYQDSITDYNLRRLSDTVYERILQEIYTVLNDIMPLYKAYDQGLITMEEEVWLNQLIIDKKPYKPLKK